ncbi:hypothetical protein [Ensifer sp. ZNC0028]|uniref:hypothetical protein n=1 Tax=Ensifer sp. ZNC0028 TaxID=1339236 RepID=UPI000A590682|nr:hypothetical protein [Ensifer sp. ZNC0028]
MSFHSAFSPTSAQAVGRSGFDEMGLSRWTGNEDVRGDPAVSAVSTSSAIATVSSGARMSNVAIVKARSAAPGMSAAAAVSAVPAPAAQAALPGLTKDREAMAGLCKRADRDFRCLQHTARAAAAPVLSVRAVPAIAAVAFVDRNGIGCGRPEYRSAYAERPAVASGLSVAAVTAGRTIERAAKETIDGMGRGQNADMVFLGPGFACKNVEALNHHRKYIAPDDEPCARGKCQAFDVQDGVELLAGADIPVARGCAEVEHGSFAKFDASGRHDLQPRREMFAHSLDVVGVKCPSGKDVSLAAVMHALPKARPTAEVAETLKASSAGTFAGVRHPLSQGVDVGNAKPGCFDLSGFQSQEIVAGSGRDRLELRQGHPLGARCRKVAGIHRFSPWS